MTSVMHEAEVKRRKEQARGLIWTPAQAANSAVKYYEFLQAHPGITWGIPQIDNNCLPQRPGDVIGLVGRPGGGKSTVMAYLAKHRAEELARAGLYDRECVAYISLEQSVEEMEALFQATEAHTVSHYMRGQLTLDEVRGHSLSRPGLPVYTIGQSVMERRDMPRLTFENIYLALMGLEAEFGIKPSLICLDYIQIVPIERAVERMTQVSEAITRSKELAKALACPVVMGVQASRATDEREDKMPTIADCQWASAMEQVADKLYSITRPYLNQNMRQKGFKFRGQLIYPEDVTPEMLLMRKLKERFNPGAGDTYLLTMRPELVRLADRELEIYEEQQTMETARLLP